MQRIVTIQDISCVGKCSLTVALPIISAMGVETAIIPTAVLSTHTMFQNYTFHDLTDEIAPIARHWQQEQIDFAAIYTGYLGSKRQVQLISDFFDQFKSEDNFIFVDPVMADNGKLYPLFDLDFAAQMARLCAKADIIVPNLTEACMLCGRPFEDTASMPERALTEYVAGLLYALSEIGPQKVVITGIAAGAGNIVTAGLDVSAASMDRTPFFVSLKRVGGAYPGTGELFASVMLGKLLSGAAFPSAVAAASAFVRDVIDFSMGFDTPSREGVSLEPCLHRLSEL